MRIQLRLLNATAALLRLKCITKTVSRDKRAESNTTNVTLEVDWLHEYALRCTARFVYTEAQMY